MIDEKMFDRLTKLLELTRSNQDAESLSAIRCSNNILDKFNLRWPDILKSRVEIKIVEKIVRVPINPAPTDYESIFDYIDEHGAPSDFIESLK